MNRGNPSFSGRRYGGLLLSVLLLVAAVPAVFGGISGHDFLMYDDEPHLVNNPQLNPVTWRGVAQFWQEPYWGLYIPLSYTFFAAEAAVAGGPLDPTVFHIGSLALHLACVLLVFAILRRLFRHDGAACAGALLFALHPVQVESVAWISETRGLLCAMFSLLAIWLFDLWCAGTMHCRRRLQSPNNPADNASATGVASYNSPPTADSSTSTRIPATICYALAAAVFLLALLSKPAAVAVPLVAGVLGLGLLRGPSRRILLGLSLWLVLAAGWVLLTKFQQPSGQMAFVPPVWTRPLIAGDALAFYLRKLVAPVRCGPDYGRSPAWVIEQWWFYLAWILPAGLLVALACLRNRRRWLTAAGVSIAWLVPVLGLLPFHFQRISTVADRYLYLSLLGPALALSWFLARRWNRLTIGATAVVLFLLAGLSFVQTSHWRDNDSLIKHSLRVNPRSVLAKHHRGVLLNRKGEHAKAIKWYRDVLEDHPQFEEAYVNLANSLVILDRVEEAEKALREALRQIPTRPAIHCKLAEVLASRGATKEAEERYGKAYELDEDFAPAYFGLGKLCFDQGRAEEAIGFYRKAVDVDPYYAEARVNLGIVLETQRKYDEARHHYREALRIRPDWPQAHFNLGNLYRRHGALDAAEHHYRAALKSYPKYARAHVNLGITLFEQDKIREAIRHYQEALQIQPDLVEAHVHLGRALALEGRPEEAAAAYRAALELVPADSKEAQQIRQLLRRYENR